MFFAGDIAAVAARTDFDTVNVMPPLVTRTSPTLARVKTKSWRVTTTRPNHTSGIYA